MKGILFYPVYALIWFITLLPLPLLYLLSDFCYLILHYLARYRRKVVYGNLKKSFPDKSHREIKHIARRFYRCLCDYFIESVYRIHMDEEENARRFHYTNPELLLDLHKKGKSIVLLLSHYGNWEWPTRLPQLAPFSILAIYKPLTNKYIDNLFLKLRSQFGAIGVPMESTLRTLLTYHQNKQPVILYTLGDQRPQWTSIQHWTTFLNQDTPVITGPEKIARKFDYSVCFLDIQKIRRGYYRAGFKLICEHPGEVPEYHITRAFHAIVEKRIRERPELWLWSHMRWKYYRQEAKDPRFIGDLTGY